MWIWKIGTGELSDSAGYVRAKGYSGKGKGLNNPSMQLVHGFPGEPDAGPIPAGQYTIRAPVDSHGGFALPLDPDPENVMCGRGSFLIHGDLLDQTKPHQASLGCVILPRSTRVEVWESEDHELGVIP
jgi:hypothetical protein